MRSLLEIYLDHPSVSIDSRNLQPGQIFFAIKGDNFDGNDFIEQCLEHGASYCISSDIKYAGRLNVIIVNDTLQALKQLAKEFRKTFKIPVLGITGSNGKTTTKEILAMVLSSKYKVHVTKGNLNNHLGVPLTLLSMPLDTELAVIEMGANHVGEIKELCEIAEPTHGFITNVGLAHLEGFGSPEGVRKAKSELFDYLDIHNGVKFLNTREQSLDYLRETKITEFELVGDKSSINQLDQINCLNVCFEYDGQHYESNLVGDYNFNNIISAFDIGQYFNCDPDIMILAIIHYLPTNNRSQKLEYHGVTLLMDAYNANPSSVYQAISNLSKIPDEKKSVILADMLELGDSGPKLHEEVLNILSSVSMKKIFLIGPIFYQLRNKYKDYIFFKDTAQAKAEINWNDLKGHTVLLKGSRGLKLETLLS